MTINLGTSHCCVCSRGCHHIGGPWFCESHKDRGTGTVNVPSGPVAPPSLGLHACQLERQRDVTAYSEQYLIRCRCHADSWQTWRPGDAPYACPVTGAREAPDAPARPPGQHGGVE